MPHVYHWKHGWIPLDHEAALSKAKGNEGLAHRLVPPSKALSGAGVHEHLGKPNLTSSQSKALARHQDALYHQLNSYLRTGNEHAEDDNMGSHVVSKAELDRVSGQLDAAFQNAKPTTKPLTVYRGVSGALPANPHVGETVTDKGYMSTSSDPAAISVFRWNKEGTKQERSWRITVPPGSKAISIFNTQPGGNAQEGEVLLPRGTRLRVVGVSRDHIDAQVVPDNLRAATLGGAVTEPFSDEVFAAAVGHEKVGHTDQGLWHHKGMQLPAFIQRIANDLIKERGMTESRAIATAISMCKKWAAGGKDVKPETRAKAAGAIAEWERLKAQASKTRAAADDAPEFLAASTLTGVELARPGAWKLSTGPRTFTEQMLRDAADFYTATASEGIPIGLGHVDARFDGEPAFGHVANIRYAEDDRGPVLLGDLVDMADWVAAAAPKHWPQRSIEGFTDFEYGGRTYALALTRLALLGATPPAIMNLQHLREAVAAAAASGAEFIAATAPDPTGEPVEPDPETLPDPGTESSPLLDANPPTQEGAGMDPAKLREAVGLTPDASDDEVMAALAAGGLKVAASAPPTPPPDPATPPAPTTDHASAPAPAPNGGKPTPGTVVIDSSQLEEIRATATRMRVLEERIQRGDRDELISSAIKAGKFPQARRQHWETAYNADPEGTKAVIASMAANLVPIAASGYAGDPDAEFDADYSTLYPPEVKVRG